MKTFQQTALANVKRHRNLVFSASLAGTLGAAALLAFLLHQSRTELAQLKGAPPTSDGPEISAVVTELKRQIAEEEKQAAEKNEADILVLKAVDLELGFTVREERTVEGKLETKLIAVTNTNSISSERVQKIVLHLDPAQPRLNNLDARDGLSAQPPPPKAGRLKQ